MQEVERKQRRGRMMVKNEGGEDQNLTDQNCKRIVFLIPTNVTYV